MSRWRIESERKDAAKRYASRSVGGNEITDEKSRVIRVKIKGLFSRNLKLATAQTIRNLKLAPQRVERATVAACSHLTDIAENLIYDAAARAS
ncbi:hypothetical protein EVAR_55270_1 [Eumeta japonica]|uniref:Uncharacterized protein n=1 Tax=Eumeta variegata TaxID=151549 RepID=A0A4C1ZGS1_EUMVA|nr:hypothetical protein EVAR_55270_1 [Eumeta japonica]